MQTIRTNMRTALAAHSIPTATAYPTKCYYVRHAHAYAYGVMAEKANAGLRRQRWDDDAPHDACHDIADFVSAFEFVHSPGNALLLDEILEGYANG